MKITINLASRPYIDLRSVLRRLRVIILVLVVVAIPLFLLLRMEQKKGQSATARVNAMRDHVQALERQQQSYVALMHQPQNADTLSQSEYLNSLFQRKAFSWTATMTDLERVLPGGVQVLSLDPAITKSGQVEIHLRVSGARDRAIELVQNLEKSRHFAATRLAGETLAQTSGQNDELSPVSASTVVNLDILAIYRPVTAEEEKQELETAKVNEKKAGAKTVGAAVTTKKRGAQ